MTELPLSGIKVIDFTGVQAGPGCPQMLAWFGADVLKVERPGGGDVTRNQLRDIPDVDALYFTMLNSNKRSLAINTKSPEGLEVMEKLIRGADVLVENFAPGAMDRMGLSWDKLQEWNPRLIFGSVKGFNDDSTWNDSRSMRTSPSVPAAPPRPPASGTAHRLSAVRPSATAKPARTCWSGSSPPLSPLRR